MPRDGAEHPTTVLHRGERYCVRRLRCTDEPRAVVCFEHWRAHPSLDGEASAEAFFRHRAMNAMLVLPAENDWFQHREMSEVLAATRTATPGWALSGYGGSMGGHAALAFSEALGLDPVIAIHPQFSVQPARAPYKARWRDEAARIAASGHGFAFDRIDQLAPLTRGWLVYDPGCVDGRHAADIQARHRLGELRLAFTGHHVMLALQQADTFTGMLLDMLEGRFDLPAFRRRWRPARRFSSALWLGLSYALRQRGDFAGSLRAALHARALPHPEPASVDMVEACARLGLGDVTAVRRLAEPWAEDSHWGEAARWCLSQAVLS